MAYTVTITGSRELRINLNGTGQLTARAGIGTNLNYARMVSEGTRPHRIVPRTAKALFWPGAAHPVRSVNHPGTRPNPYVEDALPAVGAAIVNVLEARLGQIIESGNGTFKAAFLAGVLLGQAEIQRAAPVKSGDLRRSWHSEVM